MSQQATVFNQRRGGVLLHITSLPSRKMGNDAEQFVDFLNQSGMTIWQMLPLGPTHGDQSPYQCLSAHAANNKLICLDDIRSQEWANLDPLESDVESVIKAAYPQFEEHASNQTKSEFDSFCQQQAFWLEDYVLFCEIRESHFNEAWFDWPETLRNRDITALKNIKAENEQTLTIRKFEQFIFFQQWYRLKKYANSKGVLLFGDMPIFVAHDSADVWANSALFTLDEQGKSTKVAGVPPDYFSETGQRWGNPLYEWSAHQKQDYQWWQQRLATQLEMFDLIRIDHFRGFEACWEIPADCQTAINGQWVKAPGEALFDKLVSVFGELPLVAEDLGIITDEVTALRERYAMPGMKILQFAFGGDADNPYLPHHHQYDSVAYTGTHDNNTTHGWYDSLDEQTKSHIRHYFGGCGEDIVWHFNRTVLQSVALLAVLPMQDILALDGEHRMNTPGTTEGNWAWSFEWDWLECDSSERLKKLNKLYGRI
ncbi:MAG: 4-alpha-glucanotransferase [Methylophagaceae bacterium]|jgi:4-alpha-glucanotransferase